MFVCYLLPWSRREWDPPPYTPLNTTCHALSLHRRRGIHISTTPFRLRPVARLPEVTRYAAVALPRLGSRNHPTPHRGHADKTRIRKRPPVLPGERGRGSQRWRGHAEKNFGRSRGASGDHAERVERSGRPFDQSAGCRRPPRAMTQARSTRGASSARSCDTSSTVHSCLTLPSPHPSPHPLSVPLRSPPPGPSPHPAPHPLPGAGST